MYRIWPHLAGRLNSNQLGMLLFVTPSVVNPDPVGLVIFSLIRNYLFRIRMTESKQKNLDKLIKGIFLQFSGMFKVVAGSGLGGVISDSQHKFPTWDPGAERSARSRSPADRWT